MTRTKRFIALLMSVVMFVAAFSMVATAYNYTPTLTSGDLKVILKADKTTVNPGDEVQFDMYIDTTLSDFGTGQFVVSYNSKQAAPGASTVAEFRTFNNELDYWYDPASSGNLNMPGKTALAVATATDGTKIYASAEDIAHFDKAIMIGTKANTGNGVTATEGNGWTPANAETSLLSFKMKIADSVTPGEEILIGYHSQTWTGKAPKAFIAYSKTGNPKIPYATVDLSEAMVKLTVAGGEVAAPVLTKANSQVKMTATSANTVADAFQFRVISSISAADWDTYFANTGKADATANAITNVGFVAYKGTTGFNLGTAKAAVAGTAADGYQVATTDYIQHADGTDAKFGCRIDITSAETRSDVTYVAFAQYLDASGAAQVVFYETSYEALLATNYTGIVAAYLNAFPFAG